MKKNIVAIFILLLSFSCNAAIKSTNVGKITRIHTYDDHMNGAVYVYIDMPIAACPQGTYLNPASAGFERLFASATAAMMADKKVVFQLYDDRIAYNRCEVDAIQVIAN